MNKKDYPLMVAGSFICLFCFFNVTSIIVNYVIRNNSGLDLRTYLLTVVLSMLNIVGFGLFHKGLRKDWL